MSSSSSDSFTVKVMTFNIQQLYDMGPKTWWDQANRAARIPQAIEKMCTDDESQYPDVLILNECFNSYAATIAQQLQSLFPYQTPIIGKSDTHNWKTTSGDFRNKYHMINGGVMILSRHKILEQHQYIYQTTHANTWDAWANKGICYAKIAVAGNHSVHVLGTHLQADEGHVPHADTHQVRMAQLKEMRDYVTQELSLPTTERVILGGDLNVELTTEEFRHDLERTLQTTVHCDNPPPIGSFSTSHNMMTKANARANAQSEERNEVLDYLLIPSEYAQPLGDSAKFDVVPLKAAESWYWSYLDKHWPEKQGMHNDLSDHYPVMATFRFSTA
ncbi:Sphingomyelinase C [Seminavis robusta]|uniref:sphingomyelin phosphodiesterase n=1 Tax=Seminavis robusta TaxID=568900 RepID=A0A9N8EMJ6_9STRA|nr:Sphingomyelinase C [Seminavis robusta]|eukprot:Sro1416_g270880.1 Sphingomyelinase C (331) ;mRNA; r:21298-22290